MMIRSYSFFFFFFNDTATTEIYTLSLHDALPILTPGVRIFFRIRIVDAIDFGRFENDFRPDFEATKVEDRKSTRLNSSHSQISYAVFCLKKKNKKNIINATLKCKIT